MGKTNKTASGDLPAALFQPALRALHGAGCLTLQQVSQHTATEIAALHGIGKNALLVLKEALAANGLSFAE
jgi:hypothetical protein